MRRFWMILPSLMLLAACTDAPPPGAGLPHPGVTAAFPRGGVAGVIRVDVLDTAPLRAVELVAPDGSTTPASSLDVTGNPTTISGQKSIPDPWRTSIFGSNGVNPLPAGPPTPSVRSTDQLLLTASTADIALPDPVAYRRDWGNYKIRLSFAGAGDQLDIRELAAPAPPAEQAGG